MLRNWKMNLAICVLCLMMSVSDGARILAILPTSAKSHWIVMEPLLQELAKRGHEVTAFTAFPQKTPLPNYSDVDFSHMLPSSVSAFSLDFIQDSMPNPWVTTLFLNKHNSRLCKILKEPVFQSLLNSTYTYDLVITELFGTDCFTYFAYKLNIPVVTLTTSMAMPWAAERFGIPDNPSYIPNYLVNLSPEMNIWERVYNSVILFYSKFWHQWVFSWQTKMMVEEIFDEALPSPGEIVANTSLYLVNSYHALTQSRPLPPNVVEIGGIHIKDRQPLPEDIKSILDGAKDGVILMSFGSIVRSSTLPKSVIGMFMKVFSKIPQTIFFKYEEPLPDAPENVIVRNWLPQRDMIEHKNVVAVIAHGGLASTIEAVHFNKPLIGIPFFSDQYVNVRNIVRKGAGVQLDMRTLTEDKIATAVQEITTNPRYKEGMSRLSQQYRDRPMTALQTAVYWTEYVIRHQGAPHLRPASVSLPLYQYLLLDVIAILFGLLLAVFYTAQYVIKSMLAEESSKTIHPKDLKKSDDSHFSIRSFISKLYFI